MDALAQMITWMKKRSSTSAQLAKQAEAELAALRERAEKAEEKVKSVTALMNEWRYIAIEKPMPTDRAIGLEACAEELEAALKGDA